MGKDDKKSKTEDIKSEEVKVEKKPKKLTKDDIIKNLVGEIQELKNDNLRMRADYENFRKRKELEIVQVRDRAIVGFVEDILPSIDNFEMSLKMTNNQEMFIKGVEMIHKNLIDVLKEHNFEEFSALEGDDFDINLHDPVVVEDETKAEGKVIGMLTKGYKRKDIIVRPARVQIPKPKE